MQYQYSRSNITDSRCSINTVEVAYVGSRCCISRQKVDVVSEQYLQITESTEK